MTESGQVQLCLIRSHPGPAFLRKPESAIYRRAPAWKHVSCRITPRQDKPPHFLPLCAMRCAEVSKISLSSPLHNFCIVLASYPSTSGMAISQIYVPLLVAHPAYVLPRRAILLLFDTPCYTLT